MGARVGDQRAEALISPRGEGGVRPLRQRPRSNKRINQRPARRPRQPRGNAAARHRCIISQSWRACVRSFVEWVPARAQANGSPQVAHARPSHCTTHAVSGRRCLCKQAGRCLFVRSGTQDFTRKITPHSNPLTEHFSEVGYNWRLTNVPWGVDTVIS